MAKLTVYPNGFKIAKSGHRGNREPPKRGIITGWSKQSARRNDEFLKSVDFDAVIATRPQGLSCTFTMRDCPPSAAEFHKRLKEFLRRTTRKGGVLIHYVVEWHLRLRSGTGPVPHVHMVIFADNLHRRIALGNHPFALSGNGFLLYFWTVLFDDFNVDCDAQHVQPITDVIGWAAYLSKHASRGIENAQRNPETLPEGWVKAGRMWGTRGEWPRQQSVEMLDDAAFYALRRFANRAMLAQARRNLAGAETRLADSRSVEQKKKNAKLVALARARLPFLKRRLQRREPRIGQIVPLCDWLDARHIQRWLSVCCVSVEQMNVETGEISRTYRLRWRETQRRRAARSQQDGVPLPGGETGCTWQFRRD